MAPLLTLLHMSYSCAQPIAIMPQPPGVGLVGPCSGHAYSHHSMQRLWFASETPSHLQLDRLATYPNDKAASPASRVQQP